MSCERGLTHCQRLPVAERVQCDLRPARIQVFLLEPRFTGSSRTAYGISARRHTIVVRMEDADGAVGWGEAAVAEKPSYSADTIQGTWHALTDVLAPAIVGHRFTGPADLVHNWDWVVGQNFARHALECAAWALTSARLEQPLSTLLGGVRDAVDVGESFGIKDSISSLLTDIETRLAEGFVRIKVKIAPGHDLTTLAAVAGQFPGVPLSADGNCGYELADGPWTQLDEFGMTMLEQPLGREALVDSALLQRRLRTAICLDESVTSADSARSALALGSARIVNIKPARLGGLLASLAVHDLCISRSVPVWCGGIGETGIGRAFNLALASLPGFTLPADMSPARLFLAEDLVDPTYDLDPDGTIQVPASPGNGFTVHEARVAACTKRAWESRA